MSTENRKEGGITLMTEVKQALRLKSEAEIRGMLDFLRTLSKRGNLAIVALEWVLGEGTDAKAQAKEGV